ncbi:MAG: tRNA (adenosine(37)-N6)-threonylcarbamoyltransferase complex dimerization subunit type 1 TsaB [Candidatus Eisenbacteria bacterium]
MSEERGLVLGLETSGGLTGAALVEAGRLIAESSLDVRAKAQETLMAQVERVLRDHERTARDLRRIGIAIGPGSFTGLRVGIAAAQGLCLGLDIPAAAISSHQAMALPFRGLDRPLVLLTGARRGTVMLEGGRWDGPRWSAWLPAACVRLDEVRARIDAVRDPVFLGEAVGTVFEAEPGLRELGPAIDDPFLATRRPAAIALLAAEAGAPLIAPEELDRLEPLYLRAADAKRPSERLNSPREPRS